MVREDNTLTELVNEPDNQLRTSLISNRQRNSEMPLWVKIILYAGATYVSAHVLLYLFAYSGSIPVNRHFLSLSIGTWLQILEIILVISVAAITAGKDAAHRAVKKVLSEVASRPISVIQPEERPAAEVIRDLAMLYEIGQGISQTIELQELLDRINDVLSKNLQVREFAILLLDEDKKYLQVKAAYGFEDQSSIRDMVCQLGEGISGEVARTGKMVYVNDTRKDKRYLHYHGRHLTDGSLLSFPLMYKQNVLGVVNFGRTGINSFNNNEVRVFGLVTNQIALAISNARLYCKTRELAIRDELTSLYNRRHFQSVLNIEWKRAVRFKRGLAVLMVDVDHFKSFNDKYGHLHGDYVLKRIAELLAANLREVDTVARFGGEEFIALLPDTDIAGAQNVAEKLRSIIDSERFSTAKNKETHKITISVGISVYPDDARNLEDLIDHADIALYDAKDSGRNQVICYPAKSHQDNLVSAEPAEDENTVHYGKSA